MDIWTFMCCMKNLMKDFNEWMMIVLSLTMYSLYDKSLTISTYLLYH